MANIPRPQYIDWLQRWKDKDVIKVVTGPRRCGKSTMLNMFRDNLAANGVPAGNIIAINLESLDEAYPTEAKPLYDYIVNRLAPGANYVILDGIQQVHEFKRVTDALYIRNDVDLYVTGSNAHLLSGEMASLLNGRHVELRMLPLSFAEYRLARPANEPEETSFNRYLTYGGLPYAATLDNDRDISDYLCDVFNTILVKDIAARHPKMDMRAFNTVAEFLADNVGNPTSLNSLANTMTSAGTRISPTTVGQYIAAMIDNYLLFQANRYNVRGKEYLRTNGKYYLGDLGFRFWLLGKSSSDLGHRIENVVYLELLRRYRTVSVGKVDATEVDFVAENSDGPHYYQVSLSVLDERILQRELKPLQAIDDNYPKTLLTTDRIGGGSHNGIEQVNLIDWLLGRA